jgi:TM2 domain-containing membrane protein YozV
MYCRQCGKPVNGDEELCEDCKAKSDSQKQNVYTTNATETNSSSTANQNSNYNGNYNSPNYTTPPNYNNNYNSNQYNYNQNPQYNNNGYNQSNAKSKIAAGILGIFLGALGVHNFYLGYTGKAVGQLLISLLSCGILSWVSAIWGIIEGIMILTGSIDVDGYGNKLID